MKTPLLIFVSLLFGLSLTGQDITTEGRDFWFGFMQNNDTPPNSTTLKVYISSVDSTGGKIEIPLAGWAQDFSVDENSTTLITVPLNLGMALGSGLKENKGIHITAASDITVYALNSRQASADATVVLPTPALGKNYYVMSYMGTLPSLFSEFMMVATEDNTQVEIMPSAITNDGHAAGTAYTVTLAAGQLMQVQSNFDLTGTRISSSGSCKNFAAFSGNEWTNVGNCGAAMDHLYEQLFPVTTWGKNYGVVPYKGRIGGDIFKVLASEDATTITISGLAPVVLNKGESITHLIDAPGIISADKPIMAAQLSRSQSCDNQPGDPFMIILSPLEQALKKITFNAFNITMIQNYYVNIITATAGINSLTLDGVSIAGQFTPFAANADFAYARVDIPIGNHIIESPAGFSAYVYGYGFIESFGYAVGAKLDNLNMTITPTDKGTNEVTSKICAGGTMQFNVSAKRNYTQYQWSFKGQTTVGNQFEHTFPDGGNYFVTVTGSNNSGSCNDTESATIKIQVIEPNEKVKGPSSVCPFNADVPYYVTADATNTYQWFVNGGSITSAPSNDKIIIDWGNTNSSARVRLLTTDKMGCMGDTTALAVKINIKLEPILPIGLDSLCSSGITEILYGVYLNPTSIYTWGINDGLIKSGQGTNEIVVDWNGPGLGELSYLEESTVNNVCSGTSETLTVFIEREPNEALSVVLPKNVFQVEEPIEFNFIGDTLFHFQNWDFGNGKSVDSLKRELPVKYKFPCPGNYTVSVSTYTGTVCQNTGTGSSDITVLSPELQIDFVSHHAVLESTLEIDSKVTNADFFTELVQLQRRVADPQATGWVTATNLIKSTLFTDTKLITHKNIYEYRLTIPNLCGEEYVSLPHNSIRLLAEKDSTETYEKAVLNYNTYQNWPGGVTHYEVFSKADENEFGWLAATQETTHTRDYDNNGFINCYRVKAMQASGENYALSNIACLEFVPVVSVYNVFTPNGDDWNSRFYIKGIENYTNNTLTILNRYGKPVFETEGYNNTWKGTDQSGNELSTGVYFYVLNLKDERSRQKTFKGALTIIR